MIYLGSLYNNLRRTFAYDSLNNLTNERVMLYNNNAWVNSNNNLYHYDEMSREILYLTQIWDTNSNLWKHQTKYITEYSDSGTKSGSQTAALETKRTTYIWDDGIVDWIPQSEYTSIFNDNSRSTNFLFIIYILLLIKNVLVLNFNTFLITMNYKYSQYTTSIMLFK